MASLALGPGATSRATTLCDRALCFLRFPGPPLPFLDILSKDC